MSLTQSVAYIDREQLGLSHISCPLLLRGVFRKKGYYVGIFPILVGGSDPNPLVFACQDHPAVLKHVLQ